MNTETHYTKKVNAYIYKWVEKFNPGITKLTTYDEAFVLLFNKWNLEGSIHTSEKNHTIFTLYRDGESVKDFEWDNVWNVKEGDWDWNIIYKDVLEAVIKQKLYKKPKISKKEQKRIAEEKAAKKAAEEKIKREELAKENAIKEEAETKRLIRNLKMRIYDYKKKNKDYSELEKEIEVLNSKLNVTKPIQKSNNSSKVNKSTDKKKNTVKSNKTKKK